MHKTTLSESAVANALLDLRRAADHARVPWALIGGQALISYGVPRETLDVDAIVSPDGIWRMIEYLISSLDWTSLAYDDATRDYVPATDPETHFMDDPVLFDIGEERQMVPLRSPMGLVVELLVAQHPIEDAMIDEAASRRHYGVTIPVAPLGGVLLVKMKADRKKDVAAIEQAAEHLDQPKLKAAIQWAHDHDADTADDLLSVMSATAARRVPLRKNPHKRAMR